MLPIEIEIGCRCKYVSDYVGLSLSDKSSSETEQVISGQKPQLFFDSFFPLPFPEHALKLTKFLAQVKTGERVSM